MKRLLVFVTLMATGFAQDPQTRTAPTQGPPPGNLTQLPDGHFSANRDPENAERFEVYVVQGGDTLSAIAAQVLGNPRLWPQLWEFNEHIINPHWIYPDDQILIRPITLITGQTAAPPSPTAPPPSQPAPYIPPEPPRTPQVTFEPPPARVVAEVKASDIYCSGFIRMAPVGEDLKVIARFDTDRGALASDGDYIYLSQGSEDGVAAGGMYQVIRPTRNVESPQRGAGAERRLGRHYLDVAQVQVVLTQPDFALARVVHNCDAIEIGDLMLPWQAVTPPVLPRPRPFSPFIVVAGDVKGTVVLARGAVMNFGSVFRGAGVTPGVRRGDLAPLETGVGATGEVVYIDIGERDNVRPGDLFVVYRGIRLDGQLYPMPAEARRLRDQRTAIGELVVLKTEERASSALVTYALDGISAGDAVERR